jgi:hypothetical protein
MVACPSSESKKSESARSAIGAGPASTANPDDTFAASLDRLNLENIDAATITSSAG